MNPRSQRLPSNWRKVRLRVLWRDGGVCQIADPLVCLGRATEVDHIVNGDDHSEGNLQAVCARCHHAKTLREAAEQTNRKLAYGKLPEQRHPGGV